MKAMSMKRAMQEYNLKGLSVKQAASLCRVSIPTMLKELKKRNLYEPRLKVKPPSVDEIVNAAGKVRAEWSDEERKRRWIGHWS